MHKKILVISFSQTGQLDQLVKSVTGPLVANSEIEVDFCTLEPVEAFPFPWPFIRFFNNFPDTVYELPVALKPVAIPAQDYDLIILAYTVWFLSPSRPISSFLNSAQAEQLFKGKPVITLIGCRNMWLMAQEKVKARLSAMGARLIDNVVLTDAVDNFVSLFATPLWMLTGSKGPFLGGMIPAAGISAEEILHARRFGNAIAAQLPKAQGELHTMLQGLGAVCVDEKIIASEKIAHRSFKLWGKLLLSLGSQSSIMRRAVIFIYVIFLVIMLLTVVPLNSVIKRLLAPITKQHIQKQKAYYAAPSGEANQGASALEQ